MSGRLVSGVVAIGLVAAAVGIFVLSRPDPRAKGASARPATQVSREAPPADTVGPFFVGVSSLDVEANERAARVFEDLAQKLPRETAVWANLGLARLRVGELDGAEQALATAAKLSPHNDQVALLQATIDEDRGEFGRAIERLRTLPDPDVAALNRLADLLGRTGAEADLREQLEIFERMRRLEPANLVVAFNRARLLARMENQALLEEALKAFDANREQWSAAATRQLDSARDAVAAGNFRVAARELTFLQNLNLETAEYQADLATLGMAGGSIGQPIREFVNYRQPGVVFAPADTGLRFNAVPDAALTANRTFYVALQVSGVSGPSLVSISNDRLRIREGVELPLSPAHAPTGRSSIVAADLNGDFLPDLAWSDGAGVKIWIQNEDGQFVAFAPTHDVKAAFETAGRGIWALDFDADGDLDLLVSRTGAAPHILRNNGDGGFTAVDALASFPDVRDVCWSDFDGDGDGDLALLDVTGHVLISWNDRAGAFTVPQVISSDASTVAIGFGDFVGTGEMGLISLEESGVLQGLNWDRRTRTWSKRELATWTNAPNLADAVAEGRVTLNVGDLDNNGAVDVVVSVGTRSAIWLNEGGGTMRPLADVPALFVTSVADLDRDGHLDLVGLTDTGAAVAHGRGTKEYHWQSIHTRTLAARADGRINSFGIGGRIEVRAGALLAMAPITSPFTHFGLGDGNEVGVARIVWPNGVAQVEFDLAPDQEVTATQRLKGSCPWVFAKDGDTFHFVKDFIWRSPLGMRINSQDTAGVDQTEDWILVPGKFVSEDKGAYEFRITAELWETHFFDHVSLKIVDHPASFDVFVDERFVPTQQPKLEVIAVRPPRTFAQARDESGRDVLHELAAIDRDYLADFPLGRFQGIAEDHWVEFQLPADAPIDQPLVVVGEGWIYPTDSSLNVAISQGHHPAPRGMVFETYDAESGWKAVSGDLGFPAGKNKTVVLPLPREALDAGHRRFRLRTNLEIYWDRLGWSVALAEAELKSYPAETLVAEIRHRGFSKIVPERRKPDFPAYDDLSGRGPRWRDLEGYYTRYGDVRELFAEIDDRYVIMNAGDEIVVRFAVPPPPPEGWVRDFVLVGDGWVKDGDFNTANSLTVHPLPAHDQRDYGGPPRPLDEDPIYQRHIDDWRRFHTRFVTPSGFARGLMNGVHAGVEKNPQ